MRRLKLVLKINNLSAVICPSPLACLVLRSSLCSDPGHKLLSHYKIKKTKWIRNYIIHNKHGSRSMPGSVIGIPPITVVVTKKNIAKM